MAFYTPKPESWSRAQCEALAKTKGYARFFSCEKWPIRGLVQAHDARHPVYGYVPVSGGIVIAGQRWQGTDRPWPTTPWPWVLWKNDSGDVAVRHVDDVPEPYMVWVPGMGWKKLGIARQYLEKHSQ